MKIVTRLALAGMLLFGLVAAALIGRHTLFEQRYAGFSEPVFVEIPKGTSTLKIGELLADSGVLRQSWQFPAIRAIRLWKRPLAGEYRFDKPASAAEVFARIARGDIYLAEVRVPEGSTIWDIAAIVEQAGFGSSKDFLALVRSTALIRDIAPKAKSLEGFLFPAAYRFRRQAKPPEIVKAMVDRFRTAWRELGSTGDIQEIVTLASLVEKEAKLSAERPMIASVYSNRLRIGMKLDCDPTVIYAALLDDRYRGTIYLSDLRSQNPYNTYVYPGLPPGPIASPGMESLKAAINPLISQNLYFVARPDGSGGHVFSQNLTEHNKAVTEYRRGNEPAKTNSGVAQTNGAASPRRNPGR